MNHMGSQELLHFELLWRNITLEELVTWGNYADLQHDYPITALCIIRGKKSAYLWCFKWGRYLFGCIWKEGTRSTIFPSLGLALCTVPAWWWGMHKGSFDDWHECRRMMRAQFGKPKMRLTNKYDGQNDPCVHMAKWMQDYEEKPQPKWVHLFYHTLDVIPMNL